MGLTTPHEMQDPVLADAPAHDVSIPIPVAQRPAASSASTNADKMNRAAPREGAVH